MSARIVSGVITDPRGRIRALVGDGDWSPVAVAEANRAIRSGVATFATAQGTRIHALGGEWVRTNPNRTEADNLDVMTGDDLGQLPTGEFDLCIEVSSAGMEVLARELHATAAIVNDLSIDWQDLVVTGVLSPPSFARVDDATFSITREVLCDVRSTPRLGNPGQRLASVVAEVTVRSTPTVRISQSSGAAQFALGYSHVPGGGVRLLSPIAPELAPRVAAALGAWLAKEFKDHWTMPLTGPLEGASSVVARFSANGSAQLGVGLTGARQQHFPEARHTAHWTLAISRTLVASRVADAVRGTFGAVPSPLGKDKRADVPGVPDTTLERLEVGLRPGLVVLRGRLRKRGGAVVTVDFEIDLTVNVEADGSVGVQIAQVTTSLVEWYANVANFFSGGAISAMVADGLRRAMSGVTGSGTGLLDPSVLSRLVRAGTDGSTGLAATTRRAWVEYGGLFLSGSFERTTQPPTVTLTSYSDHADLVGLSVPGGTATCIRWNVDGAVDEQRYGDRALSRTLASGTHSVEVVIETDEGLTASATRTVVIA